MSTFSSVKSTFSEEIVVQKYATTSATKSFGLPLIVDQLFVKKFEQKTSIDVVLIVISCDANKCFEKRFSISTRDSDEEIIQTQCFKDSFQKNQGYGLMARGPCRDGVDSFGYPRSCCDSCSELAPDFGLCVGDAEVFDDKGLQRALGRWLGIRGRTFDCSACSGKNLTDRQKRLCGLNACP